MTSMAPGTVMVISTMGMPPLLTASAARQASRGDEARTTGMMPIFSICVRICCLFNLSSTGYAGSNPFHYLQNFLERDHGGVAGRGHGQGAVGGTALDGPLRILASEEAVDQARSEGIAAAYAVKDFEIFAIFGLMEFAVVIADGAPIVERGGFGFAQRGGHDLERILLHRFGDHLLEGGDFEGGMMLVHAGDLEA